MALWKLKGRAHRASIWPLTIPDMAIYMGAPTLRCHWIRLKRLLGCTVLWLPGTQVKSYWPLEGRSACGISVPSYFGTYMYLVCHTVLNTSASLPCASVTCDVFTCSPLASNGPFPEVPIYHNPKGRHKSQYSHANMEHNIIPYTQNSV